jgi:phospholipid transport system transporter-binding protein
MTDTEPRAAATAPAAELLEIGPGRLALKGRLDLESIPALARRGRRLLRDASAQAAHPRVLEIDLGGVERTSSAAIALLLDWVEQAAQTEARLVFLNWPEALARIADFSNVASLLGLEASPAIAGDPTTA